MNTINEFQMKYPCDKEKVPDKLIKNNEYVGIPIKNGEQFHNYLHYRGDKMTKWYRQTLGMKKDMKYWKAKDGGGFVGNERLNKIALTIRKNNM